MSFPATEEGTDMSAGEAKEEDEAKRERRIETVAAMRSVGGGGLDLIDIAERCLSFDASSRPPFDDLVKMLKGDGAAAL